MLSFLNFLFANKYLVPKVFPGAGSICFAIIRASAGCRSDYLANNRLCYGILFNLFAQLNYILAKHGSSFFQVVFTNFVWKFSQSKLIRNYKFRIQNYRTPYLILNTCYLILCSLAPPVSGTGACVLWSGDIAGGTIVSRAPRPALRLPRISLTS